MYDTRQPVDKQSDARRPSYLSTRPTNEQLFEMDRQLKLGKLMGADAWLAETLLAMYPPEGDCD